MPEGFSFVLWLAEGGVGSWQSAGTFRARRRAHFFLSWVSATGVPVMPGMNRRGSFTRLFALGGAAGAGHFERAVALLPGSKIPPYRAADWVLASSTR